MVINPLSQVGKIDRIAFGCAVCYFEASAYKMGNAGLATYAVFLSMA